MMRGNARPAYDPWQRDVVTTPKTQREKQMAKVFGYVKGLHATHLIDIGTQLGLFTELASRAKGMTPVKLADERGLHIEYVRLWCEAACALELLDYDPPNFRLAPFMDELLGNPDATFYVGLFPRVHVLLARDYVRYRALFESGGLYPYQAHDEMFLRSVAEATKTLPRMFLETVLPKLSRLQETLEAGARILDVGCGSGHALVTFAEQYPLVRGVGIDIEPHSVKMAQELIHSRKLDGRLEVHYLENDAWPAEYEAGFDLVTQFLVLHELRPELKSTVIRECARALRPGGLLLCFDECYPSGPGALRDPAQIFSVIAQWFEMIWGNRVNTRKEVHELLREQELNVIDETNLARFYIVTAEKPSP